MSDSLQRELEDICLRILRNRDEDTAGLLNTTRELYEKIVVLHHRKQQTPSSDLPPVQSARPSGVLPDSARTVAIPEGPPTAKRSESEGPKKESEAENKPKAENKSQPKPIAEPKHVEQKEEAPKKQKPPKATQKPEVKSKPVTDSTGAPLLSLKVGLNDRIAFVKKLFHNRDDDFNRVLSQINGFDKYEEAESFLHNLVVPEYGWNMDDEFTTRFINLVRMRFGLDEIPEE